MKVPSRSLFLGWSWLYDETGNKHICGLTFTFYFSTRQQQREIHSLKKWSLRRASQAVPRHILSPGRRPAGQQKRFRRMKRLSEFPGHPLEQRGHSNPGLTDYLLPPSLNSENKIRWVRPLFLGTKPTW